MGQQHQGALIDTKIDTKIESMYSSLEGEVKELSKVKDREEKLRAKLEEMNTLKKSMPSRENCD